MISTLINQIYSNQKPKRAFNKLCKYPNLHYIMIDLIVETSFQLEPALWLLNNYPTSEQLKTIEEYIPEAFAFWKNNTL